MKRGTLGGKEKKKRPFPSPSPQRKGKKKEEFRRGGKGKKEKKSASLYFSHTTKKKKTGGKVHETQQEKKREGGKKRTAAWVSPLSQFNGGKHALRRDPEGKREKGGGVRVPMVSPFFQEKEGKEGGGSEILRKGKKREDWLTKTEKCRVNEKRKKRYWGEGRKKR